MVIDDYAQPFPPTRLPTAIRTAVSTNETSYGLERETAGVASEVGPHWLKVSFEKGRPGAYFVADPNDTINGRYYVGVKSEKDGTIQKLFDIDERVFVRGGVTYEVLMGPSAHLLISDGDMKNTIASRKLIPGQPPGY